MTSDYRPTFPIYAVADGVVQMIEGDVMTIEYDGGIFSRFIHIDQITVAVGEQVARGQQIGVGR